MSDIDLIYFAAEAHAAELPQRVDEIGLRLRDQLAGGVWSTSIDVGKLFVTNEEAPDLITGCSFVEQLMSAERIFHVLDKCHRGRPVFASESCDTDRLSELLTEKRFSKQVIHARQHTRLSRASEALHEARHSLELNDLSAAATSVERFARPLIPFLLENWRQGGRSFGRLFTRFLREASRRGASDIASQILGLYTLNDNDVQLRFKSAPSHVVERHNRSYPARSFIGETVREIDDQRDVLYAYAWHAILNGEIEARWVGMETTKTAVTARMETALSVWNTAMLYADAESLKKFAFVEHRAPGFGHSPFAQPAPPVRGHLNVIGNASLHYREAKYRGAR